ncbi:hypothetical protein XPA_010543 [Xanthoria parietina]
MKSVQNPLKRSSREQVVLDTRTFCGLNNMPEQAELFGRAALVAYNPDKFDMVDELTKDERADMTYERDNEWREEWIVGVVNAIVFLTAGLM